MQVNKNEKIVHLKNEKEKLQERHSFYIQDQAQSTKDLKRAFTVIPSQTKPNTIQQSSSTVNVTSQNNNLSQTEEWPSLEELEALIRGKNEEKKNEVDWLELPLQFADDVNGIEHESQTLIHKSHAKASLNNRNEYDEMPYPHEQGINYFAMKKQIDDQFAGTDHLYEPQKISQLSKSWGKVVMAVTSSVITGVLIGYVLLLAVYGLKVWPVNIISERIGQADVSASVNNELNTATVPDESISEAVTVSNGANDGTLDSSVEVKVIPEAIVFQPVQTFTYTALQAGVFSKEETKQAMVDTLKTKGYPAVSFATQDGKYVVFSGLASSQQTTYQMNAMENIELYRKSFSLHIPHLSEDERIDNQLQQWVFNTNDLLLSYMKISEAQFEQESFAVIYEESYYLLQDKSKQVLQETATLKASVVDQTLIEKLAWHEQALEKMNDLIANYQKRPNANSLFAVQQLLLEVIAYQFIWFEN